jgi:hypothetical protein
MVTTLAVLWMAIIARIRIAPHPDATVIIDLTPQRYRTSPGKRRPAKLEAFMMTI